MRGWTDVLFAALCFGLGLFVLFALAWGLAILFS
jgi:hypothetical protein